MRWWVVAGVLVCAARADAQALTWGLNGGSDGWPSGMRDTISKSMNEAVALYNQYGTFEKRLTANYNTGVPTAEGGYDGFISFGSQYNTRTALHEIAHTLGVGTYRPFNGGTWDEKGAAGKLVKLFDGQGAKLSTGGSHFWPYGLNYDTEDGAAVRERHCKLVAALRFDMGIVVDSDRDGMPDDWETLQFDNLMQIADGDPDRDGITNADEYAADSDPNLPCPVREGHAYVVRTQASDRVLTVQSDVQVTSYVGNPVQHWTARYVGGGFWRFENNGKVLQVEGTDTSNGRPLQVSAQTDAFSQQWRIVSGIGAKANYWQLANRETGKLADCKPEGKENAAVEQWPYSGNTSQQYWTFEDTGAVDASVPVEARDAGATDAGVVDAGVAERADASAVVRDAGRTAVDASAPDDADTGSSGGCALTPRSDASALLIALALLLRRRQRWG